MTTAKKAEITADAQQIEIVFTDELLQLLIERLKQSGRCLVKTDDLLQLLAEGAVQASRIETLETEVAKLKNITEKLQKQFILLDDTQDRTRYMVDRLDRDVEIIENRWFDVINQTQWVGVPSARFGVNP